MGYGKKVWIFPDAELPPVGVNLIPGHESSIITNTCDEDANIKITLFYPDKEPVSFCTQVAARRVRCLRTNEVRYCVLLLIDFLEFTQLGILVGGDTLVLFEAAHKITAVIVAAGISYIRNGELVLL